MKKFLLIAAAALVAFVAPVQAEEDTTKHAPPNLVNVQLLYKNPFTMQACTDRVAEVVRKHTGDGWRIDPMPSGVGLLGGDDINIVIRCAPDLKAILMMAAGPDTEVIGKTLTFYSTNFELEVKEIGEEEDKSYTGGAPTLAVISRHYDDGRGVTQKACVDCVVSRLRKSMVSPSLLVTTMCISIIRIWLWTSCVTTQVQVSSSLRAAPS